jgi:hypothetical protein
MMKKIILLLLVTVSLMAATAQTEYTYDLLKVKKSLTVRDKKIDSISVDSTSNYGSNNKLITERAAKAFARNAGGGGGGGLDTMVSVSISTIAQLRGANYHSVGARKISSTDKIYATLLGYYSINDGGGGQFFWSDTSTVADDGGIYIKPTSVSGAGRWIRQFNPADPINVLWFGFKADNTTDNYPMWVKMYGYLVTNRIKQMAGSSYDYYAQLHAIYFSPNENYYRFYHTIRLEYNMNINGASSYDHNWSSKLMFPADSVGIIISWPDQLSAGHGTSGTIVKNIFLFAQNPVGNYDTTAHAFKINAPVNFENVGIDNFGGNGFDLDQTLPVTSSSDLSYFNMCNASRCWNGLFVKGGDANQLVFNLCNFSVNRKWGVYDVGFLGNTYLGCHTSANGETAGQKTFIIHRVGGVGIHYQYAAKHDGFLNIPGESAGWQNDWFFIGDSTQFIFGGVADYNASTYYWTGGGFYLETGSLYNCYTEQGAQLSSYLGNYAFSIGGDHGAGFRTKSPILSATAGDFLMPMGGFSIGNIANKYTRHDSTGFYIYELPGNGFALKYNSGYKLGAFQDLGSGEQAAFITTGNTNAASWNRNEIAPATYMSLRGYYSASFDDASKLRKTIFGSTTPTSGTWTVGDFVMNNNPSTGSALGWRCISSGTPGTWNTVAFSAGTYVDTIYRVPGKDSIFYKINGITRAIKDSVGTGGGGGSVSLAAIGASPNTNGATLAGSVLNLEPASASFGGVLTAVAQSIVGSKTFVTSATIGSTSTPNGTSPLTIDAASTNTAPLLQAGKNGNPAYFTIDKDGNIGSVGGGVARIQSSAGRPWFPDGLSTQTMYSSSDGNANLVTNMGGTVPWAFNSSSSTTNNQIGLLIKGNNAPTKGDLLQFQNNISSVLSVINKDGKAGLINNSPSAYLHIGAGIATANNAPIKLTAGTNLTTIENGAVEFDGTHLYFSISGIRYQIDQQLSALVSGTYTPTLFNSTNIAASTTHPCQYYQVGNVITVSGEIDIDPTTTATLSVLGISLPIASIISQTYQVAGTAADDLNTTARIRGDVTNNRMEVRFTPVDVTNRRFSFTCTYYYTAP